MPEAVFTVSLSKPAAEHIDIAWATQDETAESPRHYVASSGVLTLAPGETTKAISVPVTDFMIVQPRTFVVNIDGEYGLLHKAFGRAVIEPSLPPQRAFLEGLADTLRDACRFYPASMPERVRFLEQLAGSLRNACRLGDYTNG